MTLPLLLKSLESNTARINFEQKSNFAPNSGVHCTENNHSLNHEKNCSSIEGIRHQYKCQISFHSHFHTAAKTRQDKCILSPHIRTNSYDKRIYYLILL